MGKDRLIRMVHGKMTSRPILVRSKCRDQPLAVFREVGSLYQCEYNLWRSYCGNIPRRNFSGQGSDVSLLYGDLCRKTSLLRVLTMF